MRKIKFRAFENGIMYQQVRCGGLFDGVPTAPTTWIEEKGWVNLTGQPHTKVMQYTGLKDKNGVEIYEGDILKFEDVGEEGYEYQEGFDFMNTAAVCFRDGRFELENFASDNSSVFDEMQICHEEFIRNFEFSKVVGNIYQNPELLNQ